MTTSLPTVAHEHHARLLSHVDQMPALGELLLKGPASEVKTSVEEASEFLTNTLLPHIESAERVLYPELERMLQNRHSMTPMKREHIEVRRLVGAFARQGAGMDARAIGVGVRLATRRVLFQLYSLLKIHLAEEEAYLHIVEKGVGDEAADILAGALDHPVSTLEPVIEKN
jgi:hypothetical protein